MDGASSCVLRRMGHSMHACNRSADDGLSEKACAFAVAVSGVVRWALCDWRAELLCGCAGPSQRMLKGLLLLFASLQVGLILAQARGKLTLYLLG